MLGVYFSGTGNTKYCVESFVREVGEGGTAISMEAPDVSAQIAAHDAIVFGYPTYYSNLPKIVRDFIEKNGDWFRGKRVFLLVTMGLFSGDGSGCAARLLRKRGAIILGGLHVKMPDCIGDVKLLKKTGAANRALIARAGEKIANAARELREGKPTRQGLSFPSHVLGLLGQRLWFRGEVATYKNKPTVDAAKCVGCGRCAGLCPMGNLRMEGGKAVSGDRCTLCYRCFGHCPTRALTILGKRVHEQCLLEKYFGEGD